MRELRRGKAAALTFDRVGSHKNAEIIWSNYVHSTPAWLREAGEVFDRRQIG